MILTRRIRPGNRLAATRSLAMGLGVSRTIVTQSFEQTVRETFINKVIETIIDFIKIELYYLLHSSILLCTFAALKGKSK